MIHSRFKILYVSVCTPGFSTVPGPPAVPGSLHTGTNELIAKSVDGCHSFTLLFVRVKDPSVPSRLVPVPPNDQSVPPDGPSMRPPKKETCVALKEKGGAGSPSYRYCTAGFTLRRIIVALVQNLLMSHRTQIK
jgi:hypothetical protein